MNSRYLNLYKIEKKLGFLEEKVLFLIKKNGSKPREILETLIKQSRKKYAYTTVMTVMDKLYKKGFLKRTKIGKTYYYFPVLSVKNLKENSYFYLIKSLFNFLSPLRIVSYLFYFIFVFSIINLFNQSFFQGIIKIIFILSFVLLIFNSLSTFYLNGFFDYLFLVIKEPTIFFNYLSIHLFFIWESFSILIILLIFIFSFYFLKKIFKNSYQLKINYGK